MNTRILMDLVRARILEAHKLARLRRETPPCEPRIALERATLRDIDARLARETGRVPC